MPPSWCFPRLLDDYRDVREQRHASDSPAARAAAGLLVVGLQQRLLSSVEAFARSLAVHRRTVERQRNGSPGVRTGATSASAALESTLFARAPGADDERAEWTADETDAEEARQVESITAAVERVTIGGTASSAALRHREQELLDRMQAVAEPARGRPDAKTRRLIDWIREHCCPGLPSFGETPPAGGGASALERTARPDFHGEPRRHEALPPYDARRRRSPPPDRAGERIATIDGLTSGARRKEIQRRFNASPASDPLRILLATDAAREGLNFQAHCTDLFHFDLPWNPGRIEQRNGRIDRKLQPADEVRCHYFVLPQRAEDRVLEVLVRKTGTIRQELGSLSKVIDDDVEQRLSAGIRHRDVDRLAHGIEQANLDADRRRVAEEELESSRARKADLQAEIDRCRTLLARSSRWVGFDAEPFRDALSCALELIEAGPLREARGRARRHGLDPPAARRQVGDRPELDRHARFPPRATQAAIRRWPAGGRRLRYGLWCSPMRGG